MSKKKLTDFKPEFIKPYLSGITLEYVCALEDEVERLREVADNKCDSCACEIANERDRLREAQM